MRKLLYLLLPAICGVMACCSGSNPEYTVRGTTTQSRLNGKKIYLVPYGAPGMADSLGVDSTVIEDGKFEFKGDKGEFLARITIEMKHRYGTQDLLIVTEPGVTDVVIDSISSAGGTPQNEALQTWKDLKEDHDKVQWQQSQHIKYLKEQGDTTYAASLADSLRQFNEKYLDRIHGLMQKLGSGTAYDVLRQRYGNPE